MTKTQKELIELLDYIICGTANVIAGCDDDDTYLQVEKDRLAVAERSKEYVLSLVIVGRSEQLHKLLQYLSDEDELVGNRTHQEIIDSFNQLG